MAELTQLEPSNVNTNFNLNDSPRQVFSFGPQTLNLLGILPPPSPIGGGGQTFTYIITGWFVAGASRERWTGSSPATPPPSGHTLIDIEVEGKF